jgi:putative transposase
LKRLQRQLARKKKGSNRRTKARVRLARQHERVAEKRRDFLHKLAQT